MDPQCFEGSLLVFGSDDEIVIGLPGFDMCGHRGHGGMAPSRSRTDPGESATAGKGKGKASSSGPFAGKGPALQALGQGPASENAGIPLWQVEDWLAPETMVEGKVHAYRNDLPGPNPCAGWVLLGDGGPDVYFKPGQLDRTLAEFLEQDPQGSELIHRGARLMIEYRNNGHERRAKGWVQFVPEKGSDDVPPHQ